MTDQELDRLLHRALLDAADQEAQTPPETETPLSEGHRRRMREMLRDPLLWFRLRNPSKTAVPLARETSRSGPTPPKATTTSFFAPVCSIMVCLPRRPSLEDPPEDRQDR